MEIAVILIALVVLGIPAIVGLSVLMAPFIFGSKGQKRAEAETAAASAEAEARRQIAVEEAKARLTSRPQG